MIRDPINNNIILKPFNEIKYNKSAALSYKVSWHDRQLFIGGLVYGLIRPPILLFDLNNNPLINTALYLDILDIYLNTDMVLDRSAINIVYEPSLENKNEEKEETIKELLRYLITFPIYIVSKEEELETLLSLKRLTSF
jgi:hypothetical protein